jgi:hypothetical protein
MGLKLAANGYNYLRRTTQFIKRSFGSSQTFTLNKPIRF